MHQDVHDGLMAQKSFSSRNVIRTPILGLVYTAWNSVLRVTLTHKIKSCELSCFPHGDLKITEKSSQGKEAESKPN